MVTARRSRKETVRYVHPEVNHVGVGVVRQAEDAVFRVASLLRESSSHTPWGVNAWTILAILLPGSKLDHKNVTEYGQEKVKSFYDRKTCNQMRFRASSCGLSCFVFGPEPR